MILFGTVNMFSQEVERKSCKGQKTVNYVDANFHILLKSITESKKKKTPTGKVLRVNLFL